MLIDNSYIKCIYRKYMGECRNDRSNGIVLNIYRNKTEEKTIKTENTKKTEKKLKKMEKYFFIIFDVRNSLVNALFLILSNRKKKN